MKAKKNKSPRGLKLFSENLRKLPVVAAHQIAATAAPRITLLAQDSFARSVDPYGVAWRPSEDGRTVTLVETGALKKYIRYVAIGELLRVSLGVSYAKYQIGKRPVYPRQNAVLPKAYTDELTRTTEEVMFDLLDTRMAA